MPYPMLQRLEKKFAPARCFHLPACPKMIMQNGLVFVFPLLLFPSLYAFLAGCFQVTYLVFLSFFFLSFVLSLFIYYFFCHCLIMASLLHLFLAFAFFSFKQKVMFAAYKTCFFSLSFFVPSLQQTTFLI